MLRRQGHRRWTLGQRTWHYLGWAWENSYLAPELTSFSSTCLPWTIVLYWYENMQTMYRFPKPDGAKISANVYHATLSYGGYALRANISVVVINKKKIPFNLLGRIPYKLQYYWISTMNYNWHIYFNMSRYLTILVDIYGLCTNLCQQKWRIKQPWFLIWIWLWKGPNSTGRVQRVWLAQVVIYTDGMSWVEHIPYYLRNFSVGSSHFMHGVNIGNTFFQSAIFLLIIP